MKVGVKVGFAVVSALCSASIFAAWGAIVVSDEQGEAADDTYYATWTDAPTEAEAVSRAMSTCRADFRAGGLSASGCRVVTTFKRCGAYAVNKKGFGVGASNLLSGAEKMALDQCARRDCQVVVSLCNSD